MIPENETYIAPPEIPLELPEKVAVLPTVQPEIPDMTHVKVIRPITDAKPDDYNEAINSLVAKYKKNKK